MIYKKDVIIQGYLNMGYSLKLKMIKTTVDTHKSSPKLQLGSTLTGLNKSWPGG